MRCPRYTLLPILAVMAFGQNAAAQTPDSVPDSTWVTQGETKDCVILLHGLIRTSKSMEHLEAHLTKQNYFVVNQGYPSREKSVAQLSQEAIPPALSKCGGAKRINFVTHSLGGILVRYHLSQADIPNLGRVVMLAPPNQGSEVPDKLGDMPGFSQINGPAGQELGTENSSLPRRLGAADFDLGVVAGNRSINLFLSMLIPGKDDGKVSVDNTKLDGMNDHITLPVSHPFIMRDDDAIYQVSQYLALGRFDHIAAQRDNYLVKTAKN